MLDSQEVSSRTHSFIRIIIVISPPPFCLSLSLKFTHVSLRISTHMLMRVVADAFSVRVAALDAVSDFACVRTADGVRVVQHVIDGDGGGYTSCARCHNYWYIASSPNKVNDKRHRLLPTHSVFHLKN